MTPEQFCYWLQGRAEMQPDTPPTAEEWKMIGEHLATVFHKITPFRKLGIEMGEPFHSITPPEKAKEKRSLRERLNRRATYSREGIILC